MEIAQSEDAAEENCKGIILKFWFFKWPQRFEMLEHNSLTDLIALIFDSEEPNLQTSVFCFISKTSLN